MNEASTQYDVRRYVPLAVWVIVLLTLICIPLKIISYGYLPTDDANRHAAKAISGKAWSQILVLRDGITMDQHPGWHALLAWLHRTFRWDTDTLVTFEMVSLMLLVWCIPLPWMKFPEAWLAAALVGSLGAPVFFNRTTYGRPYLFTTTVLILVMCLWEKPAGSRLPKAKLLITAAAITLAVWIQHPWYLFAIPVMVFVLARYWWTAMWLSAAIGVGVAAGALLTGRPIDYLQQSVQYLFFCLEKNYQAERQLVGEAQSFGGDLVPLILLCLFIFWRMLRQQWHPREWFRHPFVILVLLSWLLGFKNWRLWLDWGLPALLLVFAREIQAAMETSLDREAPRRLLLTGCLALGLFGMTTSDAGSRYTINLSTEYLVETNPDLKGWLPGKNGIIYASEMRVFYQTFFKNPTADWRYILGYESAIMPPDDLKIHRNIQWNFGAMKAFEPWIKKMRPEDRMIMYRSSEDKPKLPQLEWYYAATDTWIGRLPVTTNTVAVLATNVTAHLPRVTSPESVAKPLFPAPPSRRP